MPDTQPTATVAGQSIALNVVGYPDIPNRWGAGRIRVTGLRLDYGSSISPDARHAFVTGLWVRDDGQATDDPLDRYYDAPNGDTSGWPDWIAELTRKHTPVDRDAVLHEAADAITAVIEKDRAQFPRRSNDRAALGGAREIVLNLIGKPRHDTETPRCSCGGQFPLHHFNADTHYPVQEA